MSFFEVGRNFESVAVRRFGWPGVSIKRRNLVICQMFGFCDVCVGHVLEYRN